MIEKNHCYHTDSGGPFGLISIRQQCFLFSLLLNPRIQQWYFLKGQVTRMWHVVEDWAKYLEA